MVNLIEAHPHHIEDNSNESCIALYNFHFGLNKLKKYKEYFYLLPKHKAILKKFRNSPILLKSYNLELATYIDIGEFKKAKLLLPEIESLIKEQNIKNSTQGIFVVNKALLYFGNNEYHNALDCLNEVLNHEKNYISHEFYSFARLFELIIHWEKGSNEFLPYLIKSLYRYFLQNKKLHKIENLFIEFAKTRLHNIKNTKDQIEAFKILRGELSVISEDPIEARLLKFFDVISWLESKIQNRPFEEILREKSGYTLEEEFGS